MQVENVFKIIIILGLGKTKHMLILEPLQSKKPLLTLSWLIT